MIQNRDIAPGTHLIGGGAAEEVDLTAHRGGEGRSLQPG